MSLDPRWRRHSLTEVSDPKHRLTGFNHVPLEQVQPLARRHLVFQCSICGRKHVHFKRDGCSCCADNLMHGIEVDEVEWLRLLANE